MKRGDIVTIAERGALTGKPRPALVIQSDAVNGIATRVTLAMIGTSGPDAPLFRVPIAASPATGLVQPSRILVDRIATVATASVGRVVGSADAGTMRAVDAALRFWLAL